MDTQELQEKIGEYYVRLPENLQILFANMNWMEELKKISSSHGLTEEQNQTLGTEAMLVLLGMIHPVEFEETLSEELDAPQSIVDEIVEEFNGKILRGGIRQQLVDVYHQNKELEDAQKGTGEDISTNDEDWAENINFIVSGGEKK